MAREGVLPTLKIFAMASGHDHHPPCVCLDIFFAGITKVLIGGSVWLYLKKTIYAPEISSCILVSS
jgi:hypothetical protein